MYQIIFSNKGRIPPSRIKIFSFSQRRITVF